MIRLADVEPGTEVWLPLAGNLRRLCVIERVITAEFTDRIAVEWRKRPPLDTVEGIDVFDGDQQVEVVV